MKRLILNIALAFTCIAISLMFIDEGKDIEAILCLILVFMNDIQYRLTNNK